MKMGGKLLEHKNCPLSTTNRAKGTQVTVKYLVHALPNFDDYRTYFNFVFYTNWRLNKTFTV